MKAMARDVVKFHYKDAIEPKIDFNHNSDQFEGIVATNIRTLIKQSIFLLGLELDANVSSYFVEVQLLILY
jgi:hypothetical protein